ncbi:MAG: bifunctional folylpolyglutamate synthase/dihydrofolate synthase, partial [Clostridia bacterium]|nr:bifunctional folylpolyglutamate synthase/dihydrofolate synthase [Clostridia bacterium]
MNYQESLAYIHSLLRFGIKPGLERISLVLSRLGNPQESCRCVHIAGTNGKGSTSTMLAAVCRAAGLKTGLYTSPYVVDFRERMQINGEYISQSDLCSYTQRVRIAADEVGAELTEFEFITALAFLWFAESDCDVVVLETGLGGRFDATNVISKPLASVIVPIGMDHTAILGSTLEAIAFEKAGIIKKGCPVVVACNQPRTVREVLEKRAAESDSHISFCDAPKVLESGIFGSRFLCGENEYSVGMMGDYQALNATTVVETLKVIDLPIKEKHIAEGLQSAFIPARMEKISLSPLT